MLKRKIYKKKLTRLSIILILLAIIAISALVLFSNTVTGLFDKGETHTITLTKNGYEPQNITIEVGDTILFKNETNNFYWPASNVHPTHEIYSEFDPKRALEPQETWSFRFTKEGEWRYHDHLTPFFKGVVTVTPKKSAGKLQNVLADYNCDQGDNSEKSVCRQKSIETVLEKNGLTDAFELIDKFYREDASFASECHGHVHALGEKAYTLFAQNADFAISPKSSYCGYGFYHGFMTALLHTSNDIEQAREFCKFAGENLKETTSDAEGACYHGIGHGAVEDEPPVGAFGDAKKIAAPNIALCERISAGDKNKLFRCTTGVYNGLEILMSGNRNGLSLNTEDPMWFCATQKDEYEYRGGCYTQMLVAAINVAGQKNQGGDIFKTTLPYVNAITNDSYARETLVSLVVEMARTDTYGFDEALIYCRALPARLYTSCITAYPEGFMKYGPPGNEHEKALEFCGYKSLSGSEKSVCYGRVLSILRLFYTAEKSRTICLLVPQEYQYNECIY